MGTCTSCESQRISSVPQSPETEFPPKNYNINSFLSPITLATVADSKSEIQDPDTTRTTEEPSEAKPIKGIRKLTPRRRHFWFFSPKPRVTFLNPDVPTVQATSSPLTSYSSCHRVALSQQRQPHVHTTEEQVMGNQIQKPARNSLKSKSQSRNLSSTFKVSSTSPSRQIKSSQSGPVGITKDSNCNLIGLTSSRSEAGLLIPNPDTVETLNSIRAEKKLARDKFFSERSQLPTVGEPIMSSSKQFSPAGPPKGRRTFQYQPPVPTRLSQKSINEEKNPSPSASLSQIPNLNFITITRESKQHTQPPLLTFQRKFQPTNSDKNSTTNTESNTLGQKFAKNAANDARVVAFGSTISNTVVGSNIEAKVSPKVEGRSLHKIQPRTSIRFSNTNSKNNSPSFRGVSTGVVSQRRSLFEQQNKSLVKDFKGYGSVIPNQKTLKPTTVTSKLSAQNKNVINYGPSSISNEQCGDFAISSSASSSIGGIRRPRSGRSQSRERDNPISDSEFLIDDEISDQPELTFNFNKDSSLGVLSQSSSEESLLPCDDVNHNLTQNRNGTSDELILDAKVRTNDCGGSDSAFSDVSTKPTEPEKSSEAKPAVKSKSSSQLPTRLPSRVLSQKRLPTPNKLPPAKPLPKLTKPAPAPKISPISRIQPPKSTPLRTPSTKIIHKNRSKETPTDSSVPFEVFQEVMNTVTELRSELINLKTALEESQKVETQKDVLISNLQTQIQMKLQNCACGKLMSERNKFSENAAVQTDSPVKKSVSSFNSGNDKLGEGHVVSFRIGNRRTSGKKF